MNNPIEKTGRPRGQHRFGLASWALTTLSFVSSMSVPAGFSKEGLPVGITFLGRAYAEPVLLKLAYAYEQSTHHRKPPRSTPALASAGKRLEP